MKYLLILYLCSMNTNQCTSTSVSGYTFTSHYDCVNAGYAVAQKSFLNLKDYEEFPRETIEKDKIVVKFECKGMSDA